MSGLYIYFDGRLRYSVLIKNYLLNFQLNVHFSVEIDIMRSICLRRLTPTLPVLVLRPVKKKYIMFICTYISL